MKKIINNILFLIFLCGISEAQVVPQKKYHLAAFVRLQGHRNFDVSLSQFQKMMNDTEEHSFSFKSFLKASSFGRLDYEFVSVKRANSDTIPYYYDIQPQGYYTSYDAVKNANGYKTDAEGSSRISALTDRYIKFLNDNLSADVRLDGDGDGKVDIISFISPSLSTPFEIRSYGGNWAGGIPHSNGSSLRVKGLGIDKFSVTIADSWKNVQANGIFKHEVGHNLKTWDVYDNNNNADQRFRYRALFGDPVGAWHMMTGASNTYGAYTIWTRLGFLTNDEVKVLHQSGTYRLNSLFSSTPDNVAFRINSPKCPTEFYLLEFRSRHKTFEWWHNDEGLVVSLVNPNVRGNPRGDNNPRAFEQYFLRDRENNILFNNTSLNQNSVPRLILSDGTNPGFSLNNIRIENNQLVFDLAFDDNPYINAVEYPEIISKSLQAIEWKIEANPSNKRLWNATSDVAWLKLTKDYDNGILKLEATQNYVFSQRNATITLTAPGATDEKTYLVQRGTSSASVFWMPEIGNNDTMIIPGEENSYNFRIIGDFDGSWWGGDSKITNGRGERQVLHNSVNSVYAYRNTEGKDRSTTIGFELIDGSQKSFTVTQRPATIEVPVYSSPYGSLPVVNDGKWYYMRTERALCTMSNFLRPVKISGKWSVGTGYLTHNDSLLWTIESSGAGVILRNKALGYIDLNTLNGNNVSFSVNKLANNLIIKDNFSKSYYYGVQGYAFEGNSANVQGLHVSNNGDVVTNYFKIDDNCTFFFEEPKAAFIKSHANILIKALKGYESFTDLYEIENLRQLVQNIDDNQSVEIFKGNASAITQAMRNVYNTILNKIYSTADKKTERWFFMKRFISGTWGMTLYEQTNQYLYFPDQYTALEQDVLISNDQRFGFKFEKQNSGLFYLINKALPTLKLSVATGTIRTLGYTPLAMEIRPVITFRGLKFAMINPTTGQFMRYNENKPELVFANQSGLKGLVNEKTFLFDIQPYDVVSSVDDVVSTSESDYKFYVQGQMIKCNMPEINFQVYALTGMHVQNRNLMNGIYIIKVDNQGYKVFVN